MYFTKTGFSINILYPHQPFHSSNTFFSQSSRLLLLIHYIVLISYQSWNQPAVMNIFGSRLLCRRRNNQWRTSFINQNRVNFINDGIVQISLHSLVNILHHIIAEIVKTKFIICTIGNITSISFFALLWLHSMNYDTNCHT